MAASTRVVKDYVLDNAQSCVVQAFYHGAIFAYAVIGILRITPLRREIVHRIITPVISRTRQGSRNRCLLLLPVWRVLRQIARKQPFALVFVHAGEMERRQKMNRLEPTLSQ